MVLRLIAAGNANKLIKDQLGITEEGWVKRILARLGRQGVIERWTRKGMSGPDDLAKQIRPYAEPYQSWLAPIRGRSSVTQLYAYARFLGESTEYVVDQVIERCSPRTRSSSSGARSSRDRIFRRDVLREPHSRPPGSGYRPKSSR